MNKTRFFLLPFFILHPSSFILAFGGRSWNRTNLSGFSDPRTVGLAVVASDTGSPHPSSLIPYFGAEGEIRIPTSRDLEDSHVSSYITSARDFGLRISDFGLAQFLLQRVSAERADRRGARDQLPIRNRKSAILGPPIGLEPTPNSFEANRSSIKLRGRGGISDCGFRISDLQTRVSKLVSIESRLRDPDKIRNSQFDIRNLYWSIVPDSNRCLSEGNAVS